MQKPDNYVRVENSKNSCDYDESLNQRQTQLQFQQSISENSGSVFANAQPILDHNLGGGKLSFTDDKILQLSNQLACQSQVLVKSSECLEISRVKHKFAKTCRFCYYVLFSELTKANKFNFYFQLIDEILQPIKSEYVWSLLNQFLCSYTIFNARSIYDDSKMLFYARVFSCLSDIATHVFSIHGDDMLCCVDSSKTIVRLMDYVASLTSMDFVNVLNVSVQVKCNFFSGQSIANFSSEQTDVKQSVVKVEEDYFYVFMLSCSVVVVLHSTGCIYIIVNVPRSIMSDLFFNFKLLSEQDMFISGGCQFLEFSPQYLQKSGCKPEVVFDEVKQSDDIYADDSYFYSRFNVFQMCPLNYRIKEINKLRCTRDSLMLQHRICQIMFRLGPSFAIQKRTIQYELLLNFVIVNSEILAHDSDKLLFSKISSYFKHLLRWLFAVHEPQILSSCCELLHDSIREILFFIAQTYSPLYDFDLLISPRNYFCYRSGDEVVSHPNQVADDDRVLAKFFVYSFLIKRIDDAVLILQYPYVPIIKKDIYALPDNKFIDLLLWGVIKLAQYTVGLSHKPRQSFVQRKNLSSNVDQVVIPMECEDVKSPKEFISESVDYNVISPLRQLNDPYQLHDPSVDDGASLTDEASHGTFEDDDHDYDDHVRQYILKNGNQRQFTFDRSMELPYYCDLCQCNQALVSTQDIKSCDCDHDFCLQCLEAFIYEHIQKYPHAQMQAKCPVEDCSTWLHRNQWLWLLESTLVLEEHLECQIDIKQVYINVLSYLYFDSLWDILGYRRFQRKEGPYSVIMSQLVQQALQGSNKLMKIFERVKNGVTYKQSACHFCNRAQVITLQISDQYIYLEGYRCNSLCFSCCLHHGSNVPGLGDLLAITLFKSVWHVIVSIDSGESDMLDVLDRNLDIQCEKIKNGARLTYVPYSRGRKRNFSNKVNRIRNDNLQFKPQQKDNQQIEDEQSPQLGFVTDSINVELKKAKVLEAQQNEGEKYADCCDKKPDQQDSKQAFDENNLRQWEVATSSDILQMSQQLSNTNVTLMKTLPRQYSNKSPVRVQQQVEDSVPNSCQCLIVEEEKINVERRDKSEPQQLHDVDFDAFQLFESQKIVPPSLCEPRVLEPVQPVFLIQKFSSKPVEHPTKQSDNVKSSLSIKKQPKSDEVKSLDTLLQSVESKKCVDHCNKETNQLLSGQISDLKQRYESKLEQQRVINHLNVRSHHIQNLSVCYNEQWKQSRNVRVKRLAFFNSVSTPIGLKRLKTLATFLWRKNAMSQERIISQLEYFTDDIDNPCSVIFNSNGNFKKGAIKQIQLAGFWLTNTDITKEDERAISSDFQFMTNFDNNQIAMQKLAVDQFPTLAEKSTDRTDFDNISQIEAKGAFNIDMNDVDDQFVQDSVLDSKLAIGNSSDQVLGVDFCVQQETFDRNSWNQFARQESDLSINLKQFNLSQRKQIQPQQEMQVDKLLGDFKKMVTDISYCGQEISDLSVTIAACNGQSVLIPRLYVRNRLSNYSVSLVQLNCLPIFDTCYVQQDSWDRLTSQLSYDIIYLQKNLDVCINIQMESNIVKFIHDDNCLLQMDPIFTISQEWDKKIFDPQYKCSARFVSSWGNNSFKVDGTEVTFNFNQPYHMLVLGFDNMKLLPLNLVVEIIYACQYRLIKLVSKVVSTWFPKNNLIRQLAKNLTVFYLFRSDPRILQLSYRQIIQGTVSFVLIVLHFVHSTWFQNVKIFYDIKDSMAQYTLTSPKRNLFTLPSLSYVAYKISCYQEFDQQDQELSELSVLMVVRLLNTGLDNHYNLKEISEYLSGLPMFLRLRMSIQYGDLRMKSLSWHNERISQTLASMLCVCNFMRTYIFYKDKDAQVKLNDQRLCRQVLEFIDEQQRQESYDNDIFTQRLSASRKNYNSEVFRDYGHCIRSLFLGDVP